MSAIINELNLKTKSSGLVSFFLGSCTWWCLGWLNLDYWVDICFGWLEFGCFSGFSCDILSCCEFRKAGKVCKSPPFEVMM